MTPREKAEKLYIKYYKLIESPYEKHFRTKQCALIAVDEILKAIPSEYLDVWKGETNMVINEDIEYWERVKREIETL